MSVHVTAPVWRLDLRTNRKMVLLKLADCANQHGANAFPSVDTISRDTGVGRRTVQAILAEFRASGVLVIERRGGGRGRSTVYMIDLERARVLHGFASEAPEGAASPTVRTDAEKGATAAPFSNSEKGANLDQKGARRCNKGRNSSAPEPRGTVKRNRQEGGPPVVASAGEHGSDVAARAVQLWNAMAERIGLPVVQVLTETRRRSVGKRLVECGGLEGWRLALGKVEASWFLRGANDRDWRADFDFLIQASSFTKLMEGSYDDGERVEGNGGRTGSQGDRKRRFLAGMHRAADGGRA